MSSENDSSIYSPLSASADSLVHLALVVGPPLAITITASWLCLESQNPNFRKISTRYLAAFAVTGVVIGFKTGSSREPAIAALVPASISLLGGVTAFTLGRSRINALLSVIAMAVFSVCLAHGVMVGAKARFAFEAEQASLSTRLNELEEQDRLERYRWTLERVREVEQNAVK